MKNWDREPNDYRKTIIENAREVCRLRNRVDDAFRKKPHSTMHINACSEFHIFFNFFTRDMIAMINILSRGEPDAIEYAIQFLEVDPKFYRSGYLKEVILTKIKRLIFSKSQKRRLQNILIKHFQLPYFTREFKFYANLSFWVQDEAFLQAIYLLKDSTDNTVSKKAIEVIRRQSLQTRIPSSSTHNPKNPFADFSE